jgi:hypothetical protein
VTPAECLAHCARILLNAEGETDRGLMELNMTLAALWMSMAETTRATVDQ